MYTIDLATGAASLIDTVAGVPVNVNALAIVTGPLWFRRSPME